MTLAQLNGLSEQDALDFFLTCCGSHRWADGMVARRPFHRFEELTRIAEELWFSLPAEDWKEAFASHPRIGDFKELKRKFQSTASLSLKEQSGLAGASQATLRALAERNAAYEKKFGYIFIVCATGKNAEQMLVLLNERLKNARAVEIRIAAREQAKITRLRLEKLVR